MSDFEPISRLLARQIRKASDKDGLLITAELLRLVDMAYCDLDRERKRNERANRLMSGELEAAMAETARQSLRVKLALDNMQEGLCMFDRNSRLVVANNRFAEIYDIPVEACVSGINQADLLELSGELARIPPTLRDNLKREHISAPHSRQNAIEQEWADERRIQIVRSPIDGGGFLETITDRTDAHKAEKHIRHLARHDPLTDLPNRTMMRERMDELIRNRRAGDRCAILCLDIDKFKDVNDILGHAVGDALLVGIAERLREEVREGDMVVRMGGDEFAIILQAVSKKEEVAALCERVISALSAPFEIGEHTVRRHAAERDC